MSGRGERFGDAGERRGGAGRRVHFEALVAVGEADGGAGFEAESVDVSPQGMRLRAAYLPEVGERLVCRFDGPGGEVSAEGEVCWRREEARGGEFGLRFAGLEPGAGEAVQALCAGLGGAGAQAGEPGGPMEPAGGPSRGARVRLHIEGLGSPMKARVRGGLGGGLEVGSNLEFLKVGRSLDLEDVEQGARREAFIEEVKVEVDPSSSIPQLVVTLRYDDPGERQTTRAAAPRPRKESKESKESKEREKEVAAAVPVAAAAAAAAPVATKREGRASAPPVTAAAAAKAGNAGAADDLAARGRGAEAEATGDESPIGEAVEADASPALGAREAHVGGELGGENDGGNDGENGGEEGESAADADGGSPEPGEARSSSVGRGAAALRGAGEKVAGMGRAVAGRVGPAFAGAGARARGAMAGIVARIQQKRAHRAEGHKPSAARRMTAPPPTGALRSEGRRLVRDGGAEGAEEAVDLAEKPRVNKKAAALGSFLGLAAVLAVFGAARLIGMRGGASETTGATGEGATASTSVPALPAAGEMAAAAPAGAQPAALAANAGGTITASVPLFGATPLSTTEPVPPSAPSPAAAPAGGDPAGLAGTAPAIDDAAGGDRGDSLMAAVDAAGEGEEGEAGESDGGKAWGQGSVRNPTVLKLKMDGAIERLSGASGPMGFTVSLPDRRALSSGNGLARKDKRIASIRVVNTPQGAEVTLQFKDGVPAYLAKASGDRLEIALGNESASKKVASKPKSKKSKKAPKDEKKKAGKPKKD